MLASKQQSRARAPTRVAPVQAQRGVGLLSTRFRCLSRVQRAEVAVWGDDECPNIPPTLRHLIYMQVRRIPCLDSVNPQPADKP
jgi:hypothetical protein